MTENSRFFDKKWLFWGTKIKLMWPYLEVVEPIPGHTFTKCCISQVSFEDILLFPARLSCLAESVQHDYSRNPGFGQKWPKWPIFRQKVVIFKVQNQIRVAISRSSWNHSRPYFHQKLHHSSGFLRTYYCSQLDFPAWLNMYNMTIHEIQVLGKNDRNGRVFVKKWSFQGTKIKFVWPYLEVVETIPGHTFTKSCISQVAF